MEGKEVRFGPVLSAQFAAAAPGSGDGAVDSGHDSYTPIGGFVPLVLIKLGELSPGGPGAGLYAMLLNAIQAVFVAGLMIGRTPEYLGKKIEFREVRLTMLAVLITPALILGFSAVSVLIRAGVSSISNPGPHGLSQVLYAFSSASVNNGSAFAGLTGNTLFYNVALGSPCALSFMPALALGPILEHLNLSVGALSRRGSLIQSQPPAAAATPALPLQREAQAGSLRSRC